MTENYLDITKSVMISSPAGSGKTEKLARRYIALLKNGSDVERILAITFTEKAAAEMKERILNILKKEDPELFEKVREKMPRMRISTIHSFCLKLLKRFCIELGIDPSVEVMDSFNADILWSEAIYECLLEESSETKVKSSEINEGLFYGFIKDSGVKGWDKLYRILNELHSKRPAMESAVSSQQLAVSSQEHFERILSIYSKCLKRYRKKKIERHCLDYNDLELMAYEAIATNPEWQNILYSFDEHTDHILVDEFQDTSTLQWKIIDKLTEEWRSGRGAKRESDINPTIFFVGDDKQSIYSFRGANVSIFKNARAKLTEWLGEEYNFIEIKENYRSLPAIINFVNSLFEKIMPKGLYDDYKVGYTPFEAARQGTDGDNGIVELILLDSIGDTKKNRRSEAVVIAKKIKELSGRYEIYDSDNKKRVCSYGDMAVLLRSRTHLSVFEDAMRRQGVPFVVVKGIGFYNSPEVGLLKNILFTVIDPMDDYSLFNTLRCPLFSIGYDTLLEIVRETVSDNMPSGYLFESLKKYVTQHSNTPSLHHSIMSISRWLERVKETPYAILLEEILTETGAWKYFHEKQRYVNVKKFIKLVEGFQQRGLTGLGIKEKLIKASRKSEEAKANVNTEGMDAVKIMTIHASKGLQFPVVFLPCLDEDAVARGANNVIIDEHDKGVVIAYEDDPNIRKKMPVFKQHRERLLDEEKRLFYVSATRAMDYLCMSGVLPNPETKSPSGKLAYIVDSFNLIDINSTAELPLEISRIRADELRDTSKEDEKIGGWEDNKFSTSQPLNFLSSDSNEPIFIEPLNYVPSTVWSDVTEEIEEVMTKHGDDWVVLGRAFHRIFEGISKGYITMENLEKKTIDILKNEVLTDNGLSRMKDIILSDIGRLDEAGYLKDIILPQDNSYSELPFILEFGNRVYKGRIDRVIIKKVRSQESGVRSHEDKIAYVYDYKTYPVAEKEISELVERYSFQMNIYKKAVERLFNVNPIRKDGLSNKVKAASYIFFTHELKLVPVK